MIRHLISWAYVRALEIAEDEHEHEDTDVEAFCHLSAEWAHLVAVLLGQGGHG